MKKITDPNQKNYAIIVERDYNEVGNSYSIYAVTQIPALVKPLMEMALEEEFEKADWLKNLVKSKPEANTIKEYVDGEEFELFLEDGPEWCLVKVEISESVIEIAA